MNSEYKQKLEEEKKTLLGQLANIGKHDKAGNSWEATPTQEDVGQADANTTADRFEDFEEKSALIEPLEARLAQVENALKKIADGTYGTCRVCGNPIETERLAANPAAETCMKHLEA